MKIQDKITENVIIYERSWNKIKAKISALPINKTEEPKLICSQCGKEFEPWDRYEDWGFGEYGSYEEADACSKECYDEWRLDNREELCN